MLCDSLSQWQSKPNEVSNAVKVALQNGYTHIDGKRPEMTHALLLFQNLALHQYWSLTLELLFLTGAWIYGNESEVGEGT